MRTLSLDAAQTLIDTSWEPGRFVLDCAEAVGLYLGESDAEIYRSLLANRWPEFQKLNLSRDEDVANAFWMDLTKKWLTSIGEDVERAPGMMLEGRHLLYGPSSPYFKLFEDTLPALELYRRLGIRSFVLSNWDMSLHRILRGLGITPYLEFAIASLEEGVEKPEVELFRIAEARLGSRREIVHVGDNPLDDLAGARNAGWRGLLLDRGAGRSEGNIVHTLLRVPEVLGWTC